MESLTGNGALTYPVGLLTADELNLAGGVFDAANENYYLYTGQEWWTMTPDILHSSGWLSRGYEYEMKYNGSFGTGDIYNPVGVRPSISLAPGVKIASGGDGTAQTPYEFVLE